MNAKWEQVEQDLRYIFDKLPLQCLQHLHANRQRLVRKAYRTAEGQGCIMNLLTEILPPEQRIDSRESLKRFFAAADTPPGLRHRDAAYQPARGIVRLWDREVSTGVRARYGDIDELSEDFLLAVLEGVIDFRKRLENKSEAARVAALRRLEHRSVENSG